MESETKTETKTTGGRRWLRRLALGLGVLVVGPVVLALALLVAVLWIPAASQLAGRIALERWDAVMPGSVEWTAMRGSLGGGLRIDDLVLADGQGRPLVDVDHVVVDLRAASLMAIEVELDRVYVHDAQVWVDHQWKDLGPPVDPVVRAARRAGRKGLGPAFPVRLAARAEIDGGVVYANDEVLVRHEWLIVEAEALERVATAEVAAAVVELPGQDLRVASLDLDVDWDAPLVTVEVLELASPLARAQLQRPASFEVQTKQGQLALVVEAIPEVIAERFEVELAEPERWAEAELRIGAHGDDEGLGLDLIATVDRSDGTRELQLAAGAVSESLSDLMGRAWFGLTGPGLDASGAATRTEAQALDASAAVEVSAMEQVLAPVIAQLGLEGLDELRGRASVELGCATPAGQALDQLRCPVELEARELRGFGARVGTLDLDAELEPLIDEPRVEAEAELGQVRYRAGDQLLALSTATLRVGGTAAELEVAARGRGPHERLVFAGSLAFGEVLELGLDTLELSSSRLAAPARVELLTPTRVRISDEAVSVDALELESFGGRVFIDGRVGLGGRSSDLHAQVSELSLTRLAPFVPGLEFAGRLRLNADLRGPLDAPRARVSLDARELELGPVVLGRVDLDAGLQGAGSDPTLALDLAVHGPLVEALELGAELPVELVGGPGLAGSRALVVEASLTELDLVELGGLMPATPSWWRQVEGERAAPAGEPRLIPEGFVDAELSVRGTADQPKAELWAVARDLAIDRTPLGSAFAQLHYRGGRLSVETDLKPPFATLELNAELPAQLELVEGRVSWSEAADHQVSVDLRDLDLAAAQATLGPKLPALRRALGSKSLVGLVSATVQASGALGDPSVAARVRVPELSLGRRSFGAAELRVDYGSGQARAEAHLRGPLAARADAKIELGLDPSAGSLAAALDLQGPLAAELHLREFAVAELRRELAIAAIPEDLSAEVDLDVELGGSLSGPELELEAQARDVRRGSQRVGQVAILGRVRDSRGELELELVRAGTHLASVEVELPLIVELAAAELGWDSSGHHRLRATARGLDGELLAAILGRDLRIAADADDLPYGAKEYAAMLDFDLVGGGGLGDYRLEGTLAGELRSDDAQTLTLDGDIEFDEDRQTARLTISPSSCERLDLWAAVEADLQAISEGRAKLGEAALELELDAPDFELDTLGPLLSSVYEPEGQLRARVEGEGTVAAPLLSGELELAGGAATILALRQRVHEVELALVFEGEHFELRELAAKAGAGTITGEGQANVRPGQGIEGVVELDLVDVPVIRPGLPALIVTSEIGLEAELEPGESGLRVALADTDVTVARSDSGKVERVSNDDFVHFVEDHPEELASLDVRTPEGHTQVRTQPRATPESTTSDTTDALDGLAPSFTLQVDLSDPVAISGTALDMAWAGSVSVETGPGGTESDGSIEASRGRINLFGHSFEIRRGIVSLPSDGSLDPFIDVRAVTSVAAAEVGVNVSGRVSSPELHFSSVPAMSEYEILTLLVTGSSEIGEGDAEVEAQAASLLAAVSNPQLARQLDRHLGIDRLQLGFGDTIDQPILTVGKRVAEDVMVETTYHHNAPEGENTAEVSIEYDFAPNWSLQSYFGDAANGGLGVFWAFSFGKPD